MTEVALKNTEFYRANATPRDSRTPDQVAPIDGTVTYSSDSPDVTITPSEDGMGADLIPNEGFEGDISVSATATNTEGTEISEEIVLHVSAVGLVADSLEITGEVHPKQ